MPLPVIAAAAVLGPIVAQIVVEAILNEVFDNEDPTAMLQALQFGQDAILADLDPTINGSLKEVLFARTAAILADTQEVDAVHVPEILAAIAAGGGGGGGVVWDEVIGVDRFGQPTTAGAALRTAFLVAQLQERFGLTVAHSNPDFAVWEPNHTGMTPTRWDWLGSLHPRGRAAGQTIGEYLEAATGVPWTKFGDYWAAFSSPLWTGTTKVWCLVPESAAAGGGGGGALAGEYDVRLAALAEDIDAVQALQDTHTADLDELITRTADEVAANLAILRGTEPGIDELMLELVKRGRQYMPLKDEGSLGLSTVLSRTGTLWLPERASIVLVEIPEIPAGWSRHADDPAWYRALGAITFGCRGNWGERVFLHHQSEWIRVPPGADSLAWNVGHGMTCSMQIVAPGEV